MKRYQINENWKRIGDCVNLKRTAAMLLALGFVAIPDILCQRPCDSKRLLLAWNAVNVKILSSISKKYFDVD